MKINDFVSRADWKVHPDSLLPKGLSSQAIGVYVGGIFILALIVPSLKLSDTIKTALVLCLPLAAILSVLARGGLAHFKTLLALEKPHHYGIVTFLIEGALGIGLIIGAHALMIGLCHLCGVTLPVASEQSTIAHAPFPTLLYLAFSAIIFAPVCEEILFRRFFFDRIMRAVAHNGRDNMPDLNSVVLAAGLTALLFAAIHFESIKYFPMFCYGFYLQYLRLKHRSLYPSLAAHMFNNAFSFAYLCYAL